MKLAFYAPVKNEERYIEQFVQYHFRKMKEGDIFVFVDTGSTDKTKDILNDLVEKGYPVLFFDDYPIDHPFSFDFIRNYTLSKIPKDIDVDIALDIDEFMVNENWRDVLEECHKESKGNFVLVNKRWEDMAEEKGVEKAYFIHQRSAIHSNRKSIKWKYPVHECLEHKDKKTKIITKNDFITCHLRNQKKERVSYKDIITNYIKSKPKLKKIDMMHLYYIEGNEYFAAKDYENTIKAYEKYLEYAANYDKITMTEAFENNTASVYIKLSICYALDKNYRKEIKLKHMAFATKPCRETAMFIALYYCDHHLPNLASHFFDLGMSYTSKEASYNVLDVFWDPEKLKSIRGNIDIEMQKVYHQNKDKIIENIKKEEPENEKMVDELKKNDLHINTQAIEKNTSEEKVD